MPDGGPCSIQLSLVFCFFCFWQLPGVELGSSLGAAEQQLPIEKKWNDRKWPFTSLTFLTSIALPVARPGSLAGTLQAQRSGLMETNCMIVEKAVTIHSRGSVANPSLRPCKKEFSMGRCLSFANLSGRVDGSTDQFIQLLLQSQISHLAAGIKLHFVQVCHTFMRKDGTPMVLSHCSLQRH